MHHAPQLFLQRLPRWLTHSLHRSIRWHGFRKRKYLDRCRSKWVRNLDALQTSTGTRLLNGDHVKQNLSGTASIVQTSDQERLLGVQLLAGVNYRASNSLIIGLKARYTALEEFETKGKLDVLLESCTT